MSANIKLEKFLTTSKEVHGDKYDYSRVVIENSLGIKVEIFCKSCQEYFWQRADNHFIYGHSKCARERRKQTCLQKYGTTTPSQTKEVQNKIKETNLKKYGVEYPQQSKEVREKTKNTFLEKYGYETPLQSEEIKEKIRNTNMERFGVPNPAQNKEVQEKMKETCLERYGFEHPQKTKEVQNKMKETNLKKYGVEYPQQSKEVREKTKNTFLEKYGCETSLQSEEIKEKIRNTNMERFGVPNPVQNKEVREKFKETCLQKYGVSNPLQNPFIAEKQLQNSFKRKSFIFPSGKEVFVQGYEPFALKRLIEEEQIHETDILTDRSQVPPISWTDSNGKLHIYYVDIFIPTQNRCIEVKSTWTYNQPNVQEKQEATLRLGYKYEIWVFDEKGELIKNKIN
jgi:hypothetical protein